MLRYLMISTAALSIGAVPAIADDSPAELFDAARTSGTASPAALDMAVKKLSGDDIEDRIVMTQDEMVTRGISPGTQQLATNLGVVASEYTKAELAKIFIGKYD